MKPSAFIFDVFGTLVDWRSSIAKQAKARFEKAGAVADPLAFADAWRAEYDPAMESVRAQGRPYAPLDILHRENLDRVLERFGLGDAFDEASRKDFARDWERLDPWPDVIDGLAALRPLGLLAPCSNGSTVLMAHLARHAGFQWDAIVGADAAGTYKPEPEVYHKSAERLGLRPGAVMMVAAHENDLAAARAAGLQTGYIPRPFEFGAAFDASPKGRWDATGETLAEIAAQISRK